MLKLSQNPNRPFSLTYLLMSGVAGVPRRQPHRRSGLATLPSVGAVS